MRGFSLREGGWMVCACLQVGKLNVDFRPWIFMNKPGHEFQWDPLVVTFAGNKGSNSRLDRLSID